MKETNYKECQISQSYDDLLTSISRANYAALRLRNTIKFKGFGRRKPYIGHASTGRIYMIVDDVEVSFVEIYPLIKENGTLYKHDIYKLIANEI